MAEPLAVKHIDKYGLERYRSGEVLFGDDFEEDEIREWYDAEKLGYFELVDGDASFSYGALHDYYLLDKIGRRLPVCLAVGCADGADVAYLAPLVDRFIAIEPAVEWWADTIAGKPAEFLMPEPDGSLEIASDSVDCVTCFGVLHHIPNVSQVLAELVRVLKPGGLLMLREPSSSMGDWRKPRPGVTLNERGISKAWMLAKAAELGLETEIARPCMSPLTPRLARFCGQHYPFQSAIWVRIDALLSYALQPLDRYWRDRAWQKLAPGARVYLFRKR